MRQKLGRVRIMNGGCMVKFEIKPRCVDKTNK